MDLISIIVPMYKTEKYLKKCVESIQNQTYKNLEIILVNDGSPDNCLKIAQSLAKEDERIKVISQENGGLSKARNTGISNASGKYLGFIDSDDYIDKDMFLKLYNLCEKNHSNMAICGWYVEKNEKLNPSKFVINKESFTPKEAIELLLSHVSFDNFVCNKLFKKELFEEITFPVGEVLEDLRIMYKLISRSNSISITQEPLYYYVQHDTSITAKLHNELDIQAFSAFETRKKELLEMYPDLKSKILANYSTANKMYFMISLKSANRNKNFEKKCIHNMRKNIIYVWKDFSIPLKVRFTSTIIAIFPYIYFKVRGILSEKED